MWADGGSGKGNDDDEDDEDEDYSLHEDYAKNKKRYKFDEDWQQKNRIIVPKSEVNLLLED